jgi:hypothetical protein
MSDTPRTDAAAFIARVSGDYNPAAPFSTSQKEVSVVDAHVARQLERDLTLVLQLLNGHRNNSESDEELIALAREYDHHRPVFVDELDDLSKDGYLDGHIESGLVATEVCKVHECTMPCEYCAEMPK